MSSQASSARQTMRFPWPPALKRDPGGRWQARLFPTILPVPLNKSEL